MTSFILEKQKGQKRKFLSFKFLIGRGFASEAARAVLKMASEYIPEISFISLIHPENSASIKLAEALDAKFERTVKFRSDNWFIYRHKHY